MNWNDYMLRVERNSYHERDDWGVESHSFDCYDADLEGLKEGDKLEPVSYNGEDMPRRRDPQTYLNCIKIEESQLTFRFFFLENYKGEDITVGPDMPASIHGSTNRSSASYSVSLVPKTEYEPLSGFIKYE
ncbi:MAG: hypothetical protein K6A94_04485 [Bacteroidales bacterium]|nr:hypothetical protein [Bacteroidales bacterium]